MNREAIEALLAKVLPMKMVEHCLFVDLVSGKPVGVYQERSGRLVLAESRWAWFRVTLATGGSETW